MGAGGAKRASYGAAPPALIPAMLRLDKLPPSLPMIPPTYHYYANTSNVSKGRVAPACHVRASHCFKGRGARRANQAGYVWANHDDDHDGPAGGQHHVPQRYGSDTRYMPEAFALTSGNPGIYLLCPPTTTGRTRSTNAELEPMPSQNKPQKRTPTKYANAAAAAEATAAAAADAIAQHPYR